MNTGMICLYLTESQIKAHDEKQTQINVYRCVPPVDEVYLSIRADEETPLVGLVLTMDQAKALIGDLQKAIEFDGRKL